MRKRQILVLVLAVLVVALLYGVRVISNEIQQIEARLDELYSIQENSHSFGVGILIERAYSKLQQNQIMLTGLVVGLVVGLIVSFILLLPKPSDTVQKLKPRSTLVILLAFALLVLILPIPHVNAETRRYYARVQMTVPANHEIGDLIDVSGWITPKPAKVSEGWVCYNIAVTFPAIFEWLGAGYYTQCGVGTVFYVEWFINGDYYEITTSGLNFYEQYYTKIAIVFSPYYARWCAYIWDSEGNPILEWYVDLPIWGEEVVAVAGAESISKYNRMSATFSGLTWTTETPPPQIRHQGYWDGAVFGCEVIQHDPYRTTVIEPYYTFIVSGGYGGGDNLICPDDEDTIENLLS